MDFFVGGNNMWKTIAIIGGISAALGAVIWCMAKTASDEDDFWGIGDYDADMGIRKELYHERK